MADFVDFFTGSAGGLASHTPDSGGATWGPPGQTLLQLDGLGSCYSQTLTFPNAGYTYASWTPPGTDYAVKCVVGANWRLTSGIALLLRASGALNSQIFYQAAFQNSSPDNIAYNYINQTGGGSSFSFTPLASQIATNDVLEFRVTGTNPPILTVLINGVQIHQFSDSGNSVTTAGHPGFQIATSSTPGSGSRDIVRAFWAGAIGGPSGVLSPSSASVAYSGTQVFSMTGVLPNETFTGSAIHGTFSSLTYHAPATGAFDTATLTSIGLPTHTASAPITLPGAASSFTLTGPSSGFNNNASSVFTFTPNAVYTGTVTPTMSTISGTWSPASLTWSSSSSALTATFTPTTTGTGSANGTASPTLTPPSSASYTSNAQTLAVTPGSIPASNTTTVSFSGTGTLWTSTTPTFTPSGVAGVSIGTITVTSDLAASAPVTTGATTGTLTWTDSTTAATTTETVSPATASAFTLTGPSSGYNHNASTAFTFTPTGGLFTGTITPTMSTIAGSWSPATLTWSASNSPQTAVFTPTSVASGNANGTVSPTLTAPSNVTYTSNAQTLAVSPGSISSSATTTVTFSGSGTLWTTSAPTFTPTGVSGVSAGTATVTNDLVATASVTTGSPTGTITWTDSTTSATATETVTAALATAFTLTGPASGYNHNPSTAFTFTPTGGIYTGTITPSMSGLAGAWAPTPLTWTASALGMTSVFTPSAVGSGTANGTGSPTLTTPSSVSYTSNAQGLVVTPATILNATTTIVTFAGTGTLWLTSAPTFTPSGLSGVSAGTATATTNTLATALVTTGSPTGTVTWTDSTTAATATEAVSAPLPPEYHIYGNSGVGDPVNYNTIIATVDGLTWTSAPLAASSQWTFAVRAFDVISGLEEKNVDAYVNVIVSASQTDITAIPNAPTALTVTPSVAGSIIVSWSYNVGGQGGAPTGFYVYIGTPTVSYVTPAATIPYIAGSRTYTTKILSLTDTDVYQVVVRAFNATGIEANTDIMSVTADATGPAAPTGLMATVV